MRNEIRRPLFDGTREVRALWFDLSLMPENLARQRVLAEWQIAAKLYQVAGGYLLEWPHTRRLHCKQVSGLPLCDLGGILSSATISSEERQQLGGARVCLIHGAQAHGYALEEQIDPASWLNFQHIAVRDTLRPPRFAQDSALPEPEEQKDLRQILGDAIPPSSKEKQAYLDNLASGQAAPLQANKKPSVRGKFLHLASLLAASALAMLIALITRIAAMQRPQKDGSFEGNSKPPAKSGNQGKSYSQHHSFGSAGFFSNGGALGQGGTYNFGNLQHQTDKGAKQQGNGEFHANGQGKEGTQTDDLLPPRAAPPNPLLERLHAWAAKLAKWTQLSKVIELNQENYLRKMMQMFDEGDLREALRHAVPLGDGTGEAKPALGSPKARGDFKISAPGTQYQSHIQIEASEQEKLRLTYRRTFERLEREGRIDEAVFVLAELLRCYDEAIQFLESHGRIEQAAQLAITLDRPASVAIRLWMMAGDKQRAIRLARIHNAFGDAVTLLEHRNHPSVSELRLHWGMHLAQQGALVDAVNVIWNLPEHRALAMQWLLQADQADGSFGQRAMLQMLTLLPESLPSFEKSILTLAADDTEQGTYLRQSLASELIRIKEHTPATRSVAAFFTRKLLTERMAESNFLSKRELEQLIEIAGLDVLKADLPSLHLPNPNVHSVKMELKRRSTPLEISCSETGVQTIHDACILPDRCYLIAIGEAGVLKVNAHGKRLAHYPVPCYQLVCASNGQRALALAQRGDTWRVSRIDLCSGKVSDWLSLNFSFWATQFDGVFWSVVMQNRLVVLDTSQAQLNIVWQIKDLPGNIVQFYEDHFGQVLLLDCGDKIQQWRYALPSRHLLQRDSFTQADSDTFAIISASGHAEPFRLYLVGSVDQMQLMRRQGNQERRLTLGKVEQTPRVALRESWFSIMLAERCIIADMAELQTRAILKLPNPIHARLRVHLGHILYFDQRGRLIDLDADSGVARSVCLR